MKPLEPTAALLLDYRYGLLDDEQTSQINALLKTSDEWQSALAQAKEHHGILAEAAKSTFEDVRFEAPRPQTSVRSPEETLVFQKPVRRSWARYALAASILMLVVLGGGAAGLLGYHYNQVRVAQSEYAKLQDQKEREKNEVRALQEKIIQLEAKWKGERKKLVKENEDRKLQVYVTHEKAQEAGAPNQIQFRTQKVTKQRNGQVRYSPAPGKIEVEVIDPDLPKEERVLHKESLDSTIGQYNVKLPPSLPFQPGKRLELQVVAKDNAGLEAAVTEKLPLVGELYMSHVTTDRPMYRPGEMVYFRSLTLNRYKLTPAGDNFTIVYTLIKPLGERQEILRGTTHLKDGETLLKGPDGEPVRGIGCGKYELSKEAPGGTWTLEVSEASNKFPTETRTFEVNNYPLPRLNKEAVFHRKSYGPGDLVKVNLKVHRVDGGAAVKGAKVYTSVKVDDKTIVPKTLETNNKGEVDVLFTLPGKSEITNGEASVTLTVDDGGPKEAVVRDIPLVLDKLIVRFYPEGGDLVAGVPNRVYFEVRAMNGKPAELKGTLIDGDGKTVNYQGKPVDVATFHDDTDVGANQGMGAFKFIPSMGEKYELRIENPIGIESKHVLPPAKKDGVVLHLPDRVIGGKINVELYSAAKERKVLVGAYCRGQFVDDVKNVTLEPGKKTSVQLTASERASGVYRITVFEYNPVPNQIHLVPVAERLTYRRPAKMLNFKIEADKKTYTPGEPVKVKILSTDEDGNAEPAIVLVKVINQSTIKLRDDKTERSMPTHFYLTTEVKDPQDLEYADFLVSNNKNAEKALDLLLGTQGWRRFLEQDPQVALKRQPDDKLKKNVQRVMAAAGHGQMEAAALADVAKKQVNEKFADEWVHHQEKLGAEINQVEQVESKLSTASGSVASARSTFENQKRFVVQAALLVIAGLLLLVGVVGVVVGLVKYNSERGGATPYLLTGFASLCGLILFGGGLFVYWTTLDSAQREAMMATTAQKKMALAADQAERAEEAAKVEMMPMDDGAAPGGGVAVDMAVPNMAPEAKAPAPMPGAMPPNLPEAGGFGGAKGFKGKGPRMKPQPQQLGAGANKIAPPLEPGMGLKMAKEDQDFRPMDAKRPPMGMEGPGLPGLPPGAEMDAAVAGDGVAFPMMRHSEQALRQSGNYFQLAQQRLGNQIAWAELRDVLPAGRQPFVIREYAHVHKVSKDGVRRDKAETLFWHPALTLKDGKAEIAFELSDSLATFEIVVWGHTLDGQLGAGKGEIVSKLPFSIKPEVPPEISSTDKITIPVAVTNDTPAKREVTLSVEPDELKLIDKDSRSFTLAGNKKTSQYFKFTPSVTKGNAKVIFKGKSAQGSDSVEETFSIVPEGFPIQNSASDVLEGTAQHTVTLPETWVKGSLLLRAQVYPSTLAQLQEGLEGLLREPNGCFEQTSSSNYPNVMILSYLEESDQAQPAIKKKARSLLDRGYAKLVSFECQSPKAETKKEGYEWFGGAAPPHEALTAYGLLQFGDMAKVFKGKVNEEMLKRTEKYLLDQRQDDGTFKRNARALDSFGRAPGHITDAYIVWALTEYGTKADLSKQLEALQTKAADSKDPYFLSLVGLCLHNSGKNNEAMEVLKRIGDFQKKDGVVDGATTSITSSRGRDLQIETTALATLGWLRANRPDEFNKNVQNAVKWIGKQRGGYGAFGSTQSTILALKALIEFTKENRKTAEAGELKITVNGKEMDKLVFPAGCQEELVVGIEDETLLKPGKNTVVINMTGAKNVFPYTLSWSYNTRKPSNPKDCPVHLTASLDKTTAKQGESVRIKAVVENKSGSGQGMTVAVLGLPAGLILPPDLKQIKDMTRLQDDGTKPGKIGAWEIRGRELVLYWRDLGPSQKHEVSIDLICQYPGQYSGPASRAYLYYQSDLKHWTEPLAVTINP